MTDVSVLGIGLMGTAIVRSLMRTGKSVTVWNRTASKMVPLAENGAVVADSAADAFAASPLAIVVVTGVPQVRELWNALRNGPRDTDVITLTTCQPNEADELAEWAAGEGLDPLNGAVLAYPDDIGRPSGRILCSGSAAVWTRNRSILESLAAETVYLGAELRLCSVADNVILYQSMSLNVATLEAAAYAQALGVGPDTAFRMLGDSRAATQGFIARAASMVERGDYTTQTATVETWEAAASHILKSAETAGIRAHMITGAWRAMMDARNAGHGTEDLASVYATARSTSATSRPSTSQSTTS